VVSLFLMLAEVASYQFYSSDICICRNMLSGLFLSAFRTNISYAGLFLFYHVFHVPPSLHSHYYDHRDAKYLKKEQILKPLLFRTVQYNNSYQVCYDSRVSTYLFNNIKVQFSNLNLCTKTYKIKLLLAPGMLLSVMR